MLLLMQLSSIMHLFQCLQKQEARKWFAIPTQVPRQPQPLPLFQVAA
uniref:Alternative protein C11orf30 n=1 Tax=Homo sapiens TaxID=9606 RepID=L8ECI5_HUMAN|nr:alternative protein C11orf30 [Homo sapiens]